MAPDRDGEALSEFPRNRTYSFPGATLKPPALIAGAGAPDSALVLGPLQRNRWPKGMVSDWTWAGDCPLSSNPEQALLPSMD